MLAAMGSLRSVSDVSINFPAPVSYFVRPRSAVERTYPHGTIPFARFENFTKTSPNAFYADDRRFRAKSIFVITFYLFIFLFFLRFVGIFAPDQTAVTPSKSIFFKLQKSSDHTVGIQLETVLYTFFD